MKCESTRDKTQSGINIWGILNSFGEWESTVMFYLWGREHLEKHGRKSQETSVLILAELDTISVIWANYFNPFALC